MLEELESQMEFDFARAESYLGDILNLTSRLEGLEDENDTLGHALENAVNQGVNIIKFGSDRYEMLADGLERLQEEYQELLLERDNLKKDARHEMRNADYWNNLYQEKLKDIEHLQECLAEERKDKRLRAKIYQRETSRIWDYVRQCQELIERTLGAPLNLKG
jgi:hypothetical protein